MKTRPSIVGGAETRGNLEGITKSHLPKALVIRLGALGDVIIMTPLLKKLKENGYHVTVYCLGYGKTMIAKNPNVDKFIIHEGGDIPADELDQHFTDISQGYDKVINLTGSVEGSLLPSEIHDKHYHLPKEQRHKRCNVNYYDMTMQRGWYLEKGLRGEMHFSPDEERMARMQMRKYKDKFVIMWGLSGSSFHKAYPWASIVCDMLTDRYPNIWIWTVGNLVDSCLEWQGRNVKNYCERWTIRKTFLLTKYVNLVVSPETGLLNAAGCYDTPKIALLSHSSEENLTKYFTNCQSLHADVSCYPCHQLHYSLTSCPLNAVTGGPVCMSNLKVKDVYSAIERVYIQWLRSKAHRPERLAV